MSLETPTTKEISDNIIAQLQATLNQTIPLLPKAFLRVLAKVLAGIFILLYKYGGFSFLNIFVSTASFKETTVNGQVLTPLIEWGRLIGAGDPVAATQAELTIDINVETQTGVLLSGTQLLNTSNGYTYSTLSTINLDAAVVTVDIKAVFDQSGNNGTGVNGNLQINDIISFANPLPNVQRDCTVTAVVVTAADAESEAAYRQRVKDRFQKRPQGGALVDYEIWGEETAGIINIYPYTGIDPGEVDVFSEATVASSGDPDGIPTQVQLDAVKASIELDELGLATRRPANGFVNSLPITRIGFVVTVSGISLVGSLVVVQADITEALIQYFLSKEPFIHGVSILPRKDSITQTAVAGIVENIVSAAGGVFAGVLVELNAVNVIVYTLGQGEKSKLKSVSFI